MTGVALVTGASRGIGRAIAEALAAAGHPVAIVARHPDTTRQAAEELGRRHRIPTLAIPADLSEAAAPAGVVARCAAELGPIAILVHNAGTAPSGRFEDTDDQILDSVLDLHVRAAFRLSRAALPQLRSSGRGTVVFLGSTAGLRGYPFTSAYTAAKHGMVGLARALSAEWAREPALSAYVVCPGFVDTSITREAARNVAARGRKTEDEALAAFAAMNRIGRLHQAHEVASAVERLVRERPAGTVLDLDAEVPVLEP